MAACSTCAGLSALGPCMFRLDCIVAEATTQRLHYVKLYPTIHNFTIQDTINILYHAIILLRCYAITLSRYTVILLGVSAPLCYADVLLCDTSIL